MHVAGHDWLRFLNRIRRVSELKRRCAWVNDSTEIESVLICIISHAMHEVGIRRVLVIGLGLDEEFDFGTQAGCDPVLTRESTR